jgi:hypothetical protein
MIWNNELEMMSKEGAMTEFALLPRHLPGKPERNHEKTLFRIVGLPDKIRIS